MRYRRAVAIVGRERAFIETTRSRWRQQSRAARPLGWSHHTMAARYLETIVLLRRRAEGLAARALGAAASGVSRALGHRRDGLETRGDRVC